MLTIALTDHGTLSGAVPLVTEAAKAGLKVDHWL
jgi:DNA polymerase III alpha subunit